MILECRFGLKTAIPCHYLYMAAATETREAFSGEPRAILHTFFFSFKESLIAFSRSRLGDELQLPGCPIGLFHPLGYPTYLAMVRLIWGRGMSTFDLDLVWMAFIKFVIAADTCSYLFCAGCPHS